MCQGGGKDDKEKLGIGANRWKLINAGRRLKSREEGEKGVITEEFLVWNHVLPIETHLLSQSFMYISVRSLTHVLGDKQNKQYTLCNSTTNGKTDRQESLLQASELSLQL